MAILPFGAHTDMLLLPNMLRHSKSANHRFSEGNSQPGKKEGEERREGGCDKIYNDIINLEKQRGLFDTNTNSLTDTLQHNLVFLYSGTMHSLMLRNNKKQEDVIKTDT